MRIVAERMWKFLLLVVAVCSLHQAIAQSAGDGLAGSDPATADTGIVQGEPFSAISYVRKIRILPDGKQEFIRNLRYPEEVARDTAGRVRIGIVTLLQPECDRLDMLVPPPCPVKTIIVFDPNQPTLIDWLEGEAAGHVTAIRRLTPEQVEDARHSTSIMPEDVRSTQSDERDTTIENLGDKSLEGVLATGMRTTKVICVQEAGTRKCRRTIHEIWVSRKMDLVLRIVEGDPQGEESISGLEHLSRSPDMATFEPPDGYVTQHPGTKYSDHFIDLLASWFVAEPDGNDTLRALGISSVLSCSTTGPNVDGTVTTKAAIRVSRDSCSSGPHPPVCYRPVCPARTIDLSALPLLWIGGSTQATGFRPCLRSGEIVVIDRQWNGFASGHVRKDPLPPEVSHRARKERVRRDEPVGLVEIAHIMAFEVERT